MWRKFLPREFNFNELFEKQIGYAVEAASCLRKIAESGTVDENTFNKVKTLEHQCDEITHEIMGQLNKTFITPFDREDIHALAKELDDIVDTINTLVNRLKVFKITGVDKTLVEFASVIEDSVHAVVQAIKGLRDMRHVQSVREACVEINRLENVGDAMRDRVHGELFDNEKDPITIIKWKEIYQEAETILDICEDVAHIVETILMKQA